MTRNGTRFSATDLACLRGGRLVFRDLSLELAGGGAIVLTGPNGSGKTSLLRVLSGLIEPVAGNMTWNGQTANAADHRDRVALIGHADAVKPALSVREDLAFWAAVNLSETPVDAAIEATGLQIQADLPGQYLSAGQRRRLALARLMLAEADLWLMDEPSVGLDAGSVDRLRAMIAAHRAAGGMVIAATHIDLGLGDAGALDMDAYAVAPMETVG
ncbi:MAG: heme ABC exporter ATP-binding protein CcmA [Alphaproteobacteria bacterium]